MSFSEGVGHIFWHPKCIWADFRPVFQGSNFDEKYVEFPPHQPNKQRRRAHHFFHLIFPPEQRFLARPFAKGKAPWSRLAQMPSKRARVDSSPEGYPDVMNPKPRGEGLPGLTRSRHEASHSVITPERVVFGADCLDGIQGARPRTSLRRR